MEQRSERSGVSDPLGGTMKVGSRTTWLAWLVVVASLMACTSPYFNRYRSGISQNQRALQSLRLGMSSAGVLEVMGSGEVVRYKKIYLVDPWRSESFSLVDGSDVLILFYLTEPPLMFGPPEDQSLTPIVLENDRLVGWGWYYLRQNTDRYRSAGPR